MPTAKVSVRVKNNKDKIVKNPTVIDLRTKSQEEAEQNGEQDVASFEPPSSEPSLDMPKLASEPNGELEIPTIARDVPTQKVNGILDIAGDGHGFLRPKFRPSENDVYISASQIRRFTLRSGDMVEGLGRPPKESERYFGLLKVEKVNGVDAEKMGKRTKFEDLTTVYPDEKLKLETGKTPLSTRLIDLISPIGKGQRGMIVSPPKAGKTTILKDIARGISENFPKVH